jgi:hypothetical protein
MHRFFVAPELVRQPGAVVTLPKELAHQFRDVLHLQAGEQVVLLDNSGDEIAASVAGVNKSAVTVQLLERRYSKRESPVRITLCQGLLKSARLNGFWKKAPNWASPFFLPSSVTARRLAWKTLAHPKYNAGSASSPKPPNNQAAPACPNCSPSARCNPPSAIFHPARLPSCPGKKNKTSRCAPL